MPVESRLAAIRQARGLAAADLARQAGITRQTVYAIEAGDFVPNTAVALELARVLEVSVEDIFALPSSKEPNSESVSAEILSATSVGAGKPVRLSLLDGKWVGVPATPSAYYLPEADGVITNANRAQCSVQAFAGNEARGKRLVLAGCDPALSLLAHMVERLSGVEVVTAPAASRLALSWLQRGLVNAAGSHLEDPRTGEFNLPYLREQFPGEDLVVVTFAHWEEGFVVAPGNPLNIRGAADLARKGIRIANREPGSGSRNLLDGLIEKAGVPVSRVTGYRTIAYGHLAAAFAVSSGSANCCIATPSAARAFGLEFLPVRRERFDLVLRRAALGLPAVRALLDALQRASLRRKLETLAGYDASQTGRVVPL